MANSVNNLSITKKENLKYFQIDDEKFQDIKDLLYTEIHREHEAYPSYDSRNLK